MREDFKVVHLVSTDSGGAYRAANRINIYCSLGEKTYGLSRY